MSQVVQRTHCGVRVGSRLQNHADLDVCEADLRLNMRLAILRFKYYYARKIAQFYTRPRSLATTIRPGTRCLLIGYDMQLIERLRATFLANIEPTHLEINTAIPTDKGINDHSMIGTTLTGSTGTLLEYTFERWPRSRQHCQLGKKKEISTWDLS